MDEPRAYHRPISITIETIGPVPILRDLPQDTEMIVNWKLSREKARELACYLIGELAAKADEWVTFTTTGPG